MVICWKFGECFHGFFFSMYFNFEPNIWISKMRSSTRINKWQLISNHFAIEKIYEEKEENFSNFAIILKKIDEIRCYSRIRMSNLDDCSVHFIGKWNVHKIVMKKNYDDSTLYPEFFLIVWFLFGCNCFYLFAFWLKMKNIKSYRICVC